MTQSKAILLASLAAVLVQPLVFLVWVAPPALLGGEPSVLADMARVSILAAVVAIPFVLIVGVPVTLLLLRYNKLRWWPLALIGFVAAALPVSLLGLQSSPGYSSGGNWHGKAVEYVINGELTFYGWLSYFESLAGYGTQGLVGASAFYIVWRRSMGPNNSFKPKPLRGSA